MTDPTNRHLEEIAARVRRWRIEANFTLQELAQRSRIAASTVHKIEKNQTVPTISVLLKICAALERRPEELLSQDAQDVSVKLQRADDRLILGEEKGSLIVQIAAGIANPTLDVWRIYHQPGEGSGPVEREFSYEGEIIALCEEGELTFSLDDEEYQIEAGDSIHFKAIVPHRWVNSGTTRSEALFFGTIPKGLNTSIRETAARFERRALAIGVRPPCEDEAARIEH